jgi:predicted DNA-binding transcriptional regulator AlpA
MGEQVDLDDIIGTAEVARLLGFSRPGSVNVYRLRHPDFPQPRKVLSDRCLVWLRQDIEEWMRQRQER